METTLDPRKEFQAEYITYKNMIQRCCNIYHAAYPKYGAVGITVCEQWTGVEGFTNFCKDLGRRPSGTLDSGRALYSLERRNNDLGYSPDNCYWATWGEQQRNKKPYKKRTTIERDPVIVKLAQEGMTQEELAQQFNLGIPQIRKILEKNGIVHQRKPRRTGYTNKRGEKKQALYDSITSYALANPYSTLREIEEATKTTGWQVVTALREANIWKPEWPIGPKRAMWMKRERSARSEFFSGMNAEKGINQ